MSQLGGVKDVVNATQNTFQLSATKGGPAIAIMAGETGRGDQNKIQRSATTMAPSVSSAQFNGAQSAVGTHPYGAASQATQNGVVVTAVSTNHFAEAGAGAAAGGSVAVAVAGEVAVHSVTPITDSPSSAGNV